jgi:hypothetical protein
VCGGCLPDRSGACAVAVLVVAGGVAFLRRLPEFLDDIPAAGLLLLVAYLVLRPPTVTKDCWGQQPRRPAWSLPVPPLPW